MIIWLVLCADHYFFCSDTFEHHCSNAFTVKLCTNHMNELKIHIIDISSYQVKSRTSLNILTEQKHIKCIQIYDDNKITLTLMLTVRKTHQGNSNSKAVI